MHTHVDDEPWPTGAPAKPRNARERRAALRRQFWRSESISRDPDGRTVWDRFFDDAAWGRCRTARQRAHAQRLRWQRERRQRWVVTVHTLPGPISISDAITRPEPWATYRG